MVRQILPISALLLGSFFLLFAGGVNSLILPVRGSAEGFSVLSLGLLGTGWAIGYVSGCLTTARLVQRVGHIRSFSVLASVAGIMILAQLLFLSPQAWIVLRALQGFCFAGAAMIVESWLGERADAKSRGRVFGIYSMVNLFASTAGQLTLTMGNSSGYFYFVLGAMFYSLALIPTAISSSATPKPLVSVRLDVRALWRNSPVAVFAVFMVGISNASFGALSAVYATRIGLDIAAIAVFSSIPILIGAVAQIPVGILSDRMDRRKVLVGVAAIALVADLLFIVLSPQGQLQNLILAGIFGGAIFAMYPIIVAHANDYAAEGTYIQTSGGLLMVFGIGSVVGPLTAGLGMEAFGPRGLFLTTAAAHVLLVAQTFYRISQRAAPEGKTGFRASAPARGSTPQTIVLGAEEAEITAEADEALASATAAAEAFSSGEEAATPAEDTEDASASADRSQSPEK